MKYKTWDSTMQSLRRENANLKEQVEEERNKNKVSESVKLYSVFYMQYYMKKKILQV